MTNNNKLSTGVVLIGLFALCVSPLVNAEDFNYALSDPGAVTYDPIDGIASFTVGLLVSEDVGDGVASDTEGFSMSVAYDETVLAALSATAVGALDGINDGSGPDYVAVHTSNTSGSDTAITVGCVFDFFFVETLDFELEERILDLEFETVPSRFENDTLGVSTSLTFTPVGDPPIDNLMSVSDVQHVAATTPRDVEIRPVDFSFLLRAVFRGIAVGYDKTTGDGEFPILFTIEELDGGSHETGGFQVSLTYDDLTVTANEVVALGPVADLNGGDGPDFFEVSLAETADGTTGVTIDCLYDDDGVESLSFPEETRVAKVLFSTVSGSFEDVDEADSISLDFESIGDSPAVESTVVGTDGSAFATTTEAVEVEFQPFESALAFETDQNVATLSLKPVDSPTSLLGSSLAVSAFTFSFLYPSDLVSVAEVTEAALLTTYNNGDGPDLLNVEVVTDGEQTGLTIEVVFSFTDPDVTLDVGDEGEDVLDMEFECEGGDITEAVTLTPAVLGDPPVDNAVVDSDGNTLLTQFDSPELDVDCFRGKFARGDADGNGVVFPIIDALYILEFGFTDGPPPPCQDAADVDDIGGLFPILDALYLLNWGFVFGPEPPDPGPDGCGQDPTDLDGVSCLEDICTDD